MKFGKTPSVTKEPEEFFAGVIVRDTPAPLLWGRAGKTGGAVERRDSGCFTGGQTFENGICIKEEIILNISCVY